MENILFWLGPVGSILALLCALSFFLNMKKQDQGTDKMKEIAGYVKAGAISYLKQQYKVVLWFFIFAFIFLVFLSFVLKMQSAWTPFAFLTGGLFSALSGYLGMMTATDASNRTTQAARTSLNSALRIAFRSGSVMGLTVVGLGLLNISVWFIILYYVIMPANISGPFAVNNIYEVAAIMLTFGMGASAQALFARVGGGIFTKAADVGADLSGKIEAGIPEDDPRNPGTIADNVGDNVGDVAGMGADLFESYLGSILASAVLGTAAFAGLTHFQFNSVILPIATAGLGILSSIIGIYFVKTKEEVSQKQLLKALGKGINVSTILIVIGSLILVKLLFHNLSENIPIPFDGLGLWLSIIVGLIAGLIIGKSTEYYTSDEYHPTRNLAKQSITGPATVIIDGMALGMNSTAIPVITIVIGVMASFGFAGGFTNIAFGLYGVGIAAVGMLSTLGITLSTDAYGPIADNAGGNAEMCNLPSEVRQRTDALDALGNTTAATGKGFAIGSAALTALALLAAYIEAVKMGILRITQANDANFFQFAKNMSVPIEEIKTATIDNFMYWYNITLLNPKVLVGLFIGAMMAFVFCALTMKAVGRTASKMVQEIRRQFKEIKGLIEGKTKPDYAACVDISTKAAQKEMFLPSLLAIIVPIIVGLLFGVGGVVGLLSGGLATGFTLAVMMANSGGAWDNAKKYIEKGNLGGKGSPAHAASIIGDTVGDPFKDTSGPSLNILIKLMSMVSVVVAGLIVAYSPIIQHIYGG